MRHGEGEMAVSSQNRREAWLGVGGRRQGGDRPAPSPPYLPAGAEGCSRDPPHTHTFPACQPCPSSPLTPERTPTKGHQISSPAPGTWCVCRGGAGRGLDSAYSVPCPLERLGLGAGPRGRGTPRGTGETEWPGKIQDVSKCEFQINSK